MKIENFKSISRQSPANIFCLGHFALTFDVEKWGQKEIFHIIWTGKPNKIRSV